MVKTLIIWWKQKRKSLANVMWALFFALIIWYSALQDTSVAISDIQVTYLLHYDQDKLGIEVLSPQATLSIDLRGPRIQMDRVNLDSLQISLDLSESLLGTEPATIVELPVQLEHFHLPSSEIQITRIEPPTIEVRLYRLMTRDMQVKIPLSLLNELPFSVDEVSWEPKFVKVTGPSAELSSLSEVRPKLDPLRFSTLREGQKSQPTPFIVDLDESLFEVSPRIILVTLRRAAPPPVPIERTFENVPVSFFFSASFEADWRIEPYVEGEQSITIPRLTVWGQDQAVLDRLTAESLRAHILLTPQRDPFNRPGFSGDNRNSDPPNIDTLQFQLPQGVQLKGSPPRVEFYVVRKE